MSRLQQIFSQPGKALVPFITAGDPATVPVTDLMQALVRGGANIIELGFAFSDPMADGPVIQRSSERVLERGVKLMHVLQWVAQFRALDTTTGVVLMGYLNPVLQMGVEAFARQCAASGVDGVLIVDLPLAEADGLQTVLRQHQVDLIFLIAPTTTDARLRQIATIASGYIYYVSLTGITGASHIGTSGVQERVAHLRKFLSLPIAVGFGIKDADTAQAVAQVADGVVIGSALVEQLFQSVAPLQTAENFLAPIRQALDQLASR